MSFPRRAWAGAARLIAGSFGAFTNGLTSAMPGERNVDMLIGGTGDDIYFNGGAHNNLRVTFGPQLRF